MMRSMLLLLVLAYTGSEAYRCYSCENSDDYNLPYDPNCGLDYYDGYGYNTEYGDICATTVYVDGNGTVKRWGQDGAGIEDGECFDHGDHINCYCTGTFCNNRLCQHCDITTDWTTDWWERSTSFQDCGADYEGTQGLITSPGYPQRYPASADCEWTVTSPANTRIIVNFEDFNTEDHYDYLQIRDGINDDDPLLVDFSGKHTNFPLVTSTGNTLYFHFHSDYSYQERGFKLDWSTESDGTGLQCYSCIDCQTVDGNTNVEVSDEFLACFIAIEIGHDHFVIRGGSPDYFEDGVCRHEVDGAIVCYCTTDKCNADDAWKMIEHKEMLI